MVSTCSGMCRPCCSIEPAGISTGAPALIFSEYVKASSSSMYTVKFYPVLYRLHGRNCVQGQLHFIADLLLPIVIKRDPILVNVVIFRKM